MSVPRSTLNSTTQSTQTDRPGRTDPDRCDVTPTQESSLAARPEMSVLAENLTSADGLGDGSCQAPDTLTDNNPIMQQLPTKQHGEHPKEFEPAKGPLGFFWEGAIRTHTLLGGGAAAIILTVLQLVLTAPLSWKIVVVLSGCIIAICLIITLAHALYISGRSSQMWFNVAQHAKQELERLERERGPVTVEAAEKPFHPYHKAKCVLIVKWPNMPFPQGSRVTIAIVQGTHERPLGSGTIRPRQFDQKEVVTLDEIHPNVDKLVDALLERNSEMVKLLRIGPAIDLQNVFAAPSPTPSAGASNALMERQEQ